jgi:DNA-directed RNA polymerase subunit N (RpoN/RPB10)
MLFEEFDALNSLCEAQNEIIDELGADKKCITRYIA